MSDTSQERNKLEVDVDVSSQPIGCVNFQTWCDMNVSSEYKNLLHANYVMIVKKINITTTLYSELRNKDRDYWKTGGVTTASCSFCVKVTCFNCWTISISPEPRWLVLESSENLETHHTSY